MSQQEKKARAEVYLDNVRQYPVPLPADEVLEADNIGPTSCHGYECYELSLHSEDKDIGEVKVRLYIDKYSVFSCNSRDYLEQVAVHLRKKDNGDLCMNANGAFARIVVQRSIIHGCGFAGHCTVLATDLTNCTMFGGEVANFEMFFASKMKKTIHYVEMLFSTSCVTESVLAPGGQLWNSSLHNANLSIYPRKVLDEDGEPVPTYFLNGVKGDNISIETDADPLPATILGSELAEFSMEYRESLFMSGQKLIDINLVGNTFKLDNRLSVFTINLPKGDLLVSNNAKDNWNVFTTLNDRGWMITDTGDEEFEEHLRNMLQLAGEPQVDSCIQYAKDSLESRRKLIQKINTNEYLRLSAVC